MGLAPQVSLNSYVPRVRGGGSELRKVIGFGAKCTTPTLFPVHTGLPAVFVAVWVGVRATLANTG